MSDRVYAQDEIFAAVRLLKKYHAERAILFGSYARQEADATSDIDLIVIGGSRFTPTDVFCIAEELRYAVRHLRLVHPLHDPIQDLLLAGIVLVQSGLRDPQPP